MAENPHKNCPWVAAGNDAARRKAAVLQAPDLRNIYAAAAEIWNQLSETERTTALANQPKPQTKPATT